MNNKKPNSNRLKTFLTVVIIISIAWIFTPYYLKQSLTYWYPGIEDYKIFENRTIKASPTPILWAEAKDYNSKELSQTLRDTLEHYKSIAYLIIQNDSIIYEEYWEGYGSESHSNSFSMAKSFVSLLIGAAIDEGKIKSVDEPAYKYLPHLNEGKSKELTIRNLLTMSSGSNWDESYSSPLSMTTQAYYGNDLQGLAEKMHVVDKPGRYFSYKSGDTQLLSLIVKNATGKSLGDYASEKLWIPMGAEHNAMWCLDKKDGLEKAYCCFNSNARDFARFGKLILNKGRFGDKQVISEKYIAEATTPARDLLDDEGNPLDFYGYQWWIVKSEGKYIPYARGILGQYIFSIPEKNAIIVRLGHTRSKSYIDHHPSDVKIYLEEGMKMLK